MDFNQHVLCFLKLLDNQHVADFLKRDVCGALCDKYHLIIVFQFFMRAEFESQDYTAKNFFLALTLSHDLYDESKSLKHMILVYYFKCCEGPDNKTAFHWDKLLLFRRMKYKGFMDKKICQQLCQLVKHKAFYKQRRELHTGVVSCSVLCGMCRCPMNKAFTTIKSQKSQTSSIDEGHQFITSQLAKRSKLNSSETDRSLFFLDNNKTSSVASAC